MMHPIVFVSLLFLGYIHMFIYLSPTKMEEDTTAIKLQLEGLRRQLTRGVPLYTFPQSWRLQDSHS